MPLSVQNPAVKGVFERTVMSRSGVAKGKENRFAENPFGIISSNSSKIETDSVIQTHPELTELTSSHCEIAND